MQSNESTPYQTSDKYPWRRLGLDLRAVNPISSMLCADESFYLHWLARNYYQGLGEIVDGGPLLGGSTYSLASGLSKNSAVTDTHKRITSYDLFRFFPDFARLLPSTLFKTGDSLLPIFRENIRPYENLVEVVAGDILEKRWSGKPVEVLFIDLAKSWQIQNHLLREFFNCLIPNRSIVIQQDYFHYYCYWIHLIMEYFRPYFKIVHEPEGATLSFLLIKQIPRELLQMDYSRFFSREQAIQLMDQAIVPFGGTRKLILKTTQMRLLCDWQEYELACRIGHEIRQSPDWHDSLLYDLVQAESHIPSEILFPGLEGRQALIAFSRTYNLFKQKEWIYAVPRSLSPFDISSDYDRRRPQVLKAKTLSQAGELINETYQPKAGTMSKLLGQYRNYNLVEYDYRVYGLPLSLGHTDLSDEAHRQRSGIISATTAQQVREKIGALSASLKPVPLPDPSKQGAPKRNFSFLLPTRGNLEGINRLFESIVDTTACLDALEIVLAVDDDDLEGQAITHDRLSLKKIVLPRGAPMGTLNRACFDLSSGRYVMLINDDIVLRTKGWDTIIAGVFAEYADEIALVHVNDLLFREKLCTFPMLARRACLEIGICPAEYRRYRTDDHIYDTYSLLAYLGHKRIVYLADVIFEHQNHSARPETDGGQIFRSVDNKVYTPNQAILELDARQFDATLEARKQDARRLAQLIDGARYTTLQTRQQAALGQLDPHRKSSAYQFLLDSIQDSFSYRQNEVVQRRTAASRMARTTIAVVTSNMRKEYAARCLALVKEHTRNYDLMILDNGQSGDFSHTREMNKILRSVETDYLVLMDDDVFVEPGWLEGLLKCLDDRTALVAPLHRDQRGALSFSGVYFAGDGQGTHAHLRDRPDRPRVAQTVCSALILIDRRKCADIFMDEIYAKYFLDLDYSLQVWEAGYQVVVTPEVIVTHLGGATMVWGTEQANVVQERDRRRFLERWIKTGRLAQLEHGLWQGYPTLRPLVEIPGRIHQFFDELPFTGFHTQLFALVSAAQDYALFTKLLETRLETCLQQLETRGDYQNLAHGRAILHTLHAAHSAQDQRPRWQVYRTYLALFITTARQNPRLAVSKALAKLSGTGYAAHPVIVKSNYRGFNIVRYRQKHYGLATALGPFDIDTVPDSILSAHQRSGLVIVGNWDGEIQWRILRAYLAKVITLARQDPRRALQKTLKKLIGPRYTDHPQLVANSYWGFNIIHYRENCYGLALALGPVNIEKLPEKIIQDYQRTGQVIIGNAAGEVKRRILRAYMAKVMTLVRKDPQLALRKALRKLTRFALE